MNRTCPDCGAPLMNQTFREVTLDTCPSCAGVWFDEDELRRLKTLGGHVLSQVETEVAPAMDISEADRKGAVCPTCPGRLYPYHYQYSSGIVLHSCERCHGLWVRDGDLKRILEFQQAPNRPVSPTEPDYISDERDHVKGPRSSELNGLAKFLGSHEPGPPEP